jgi:nucleotide-binding universal stress UspA family protein
MYKTIVVGTDGSDRAAVAVQQALRLAKICDVELHVVHVVRPVSTLGAEQFDPGAVVTATTEAMHDWGDQIGQEVAAQAEEMAVATEIHVVEGNPPDMLVEVAKEVGADVLVLGNRA